MWMKILDINKRANEKNKDGRNVIPQSSWKIENVRSQT
jgi:hypothetical protein